MSKITVHHEMEGIDADVFVQQMAEFSRRHSVTVDLAYVELEDLKGPLIAKVRAGTAPDVVFVPSDFVALADELELSELPPHLIDPALFPGAYGPCTVGGRVLGAPVIIGNQLVTFHNKRLLQRIPERWEDLQRLRGELPEGVYPVGLDYRDPYWFVSFLGALGGWILREGELTLDGPQMVDALEMYRGFAADGLLPASCNERAINHGFQQGQFACVINGEWGYREAARVLGDELGVGLLPTLRGRRLTSMFSVHLLAFPGHALEGPRREPVEALVRFIQETEAQHAWAGQAVRIPVHARALAEAKAAARPNRRALLETLDACQAIPTEKNVMRAWGALKRFLPAFLDGHLDAAPAARSMQEWGTRKAFSDSL